MQKDRRGKPVIDPELREQIRAKAHSMIDSLIEAVKADIAGNQELADFHTHQVDAALVSGIHLLDQALAEVRDRKRGAE